MSFSRTSRFSSFVLAAALAGGAMVGVFAPAVAHAGDDCTATKFHYPAVQSACKSGGRKAAKDLMKTSVKKMKADGKDVKCTSCHEDAKEFKLKDNAVKDLKPYI